jgi:hypothetical protein
MRIPLQAHLRSIVLILVVHIVTQEVSTSAFAAK